MFIPYKLFKNRKDAAKQLALKLEKYKGENTLVLGIPRGGVEVAYYVAEYLGAELSVIISKKIPHPEQPEYGIGAIAEGDEVFVPDYIIINKQMLEPRIQELKQEIQRRVLLYRGAPLPKIKNRTVILVDDGIASGVTLVPAIRLCAKLGASKIIVASPISGNNFVKEIYEADEIIIQHQSGLLFGVSQAYENFSQLEDKDVLFFMNKSKQLKAH